MGAFKMYQLSMWQDRINYMTSDCFFKRVHIYKLRSLAWGNTYKIEHAITL